MLILIRQRKLFEKNENLQTECYESTDEFLKNPASPQARAYLAGELLID